MKYRTKPVVVDAIRASVVLSLANAAEPETYRNLPLWVRQAMEGYVIEVSPQRTIVTLYTPGGSEPVFGDEWLIFAEGAITRMTGEDFAKTYEEAPDIPDVKPPEPPVL